MLYRKRAISNNAINQLHVVGVRFGKASVAKFSCVLNKVDGSNFLSHLSLYLFYVAYKIDALGLHWSEAKLTSKTFTEVPSLEVCMMYMCLCGPLNIFHSLNHSNVGQNCIL